MPHGMFKQCMLDERSCDAVADTAPTLVPEAGCAPECSMSEQAHATQCMPFCLGTLVVVEGLTKLPAFNGVSAVVQGWDEATQRYSIFLVSAENGCQQAKVKHENLRLLLPCS